MRLAAAVIAGVIAVVMFSDAFAQDTKECQFVRRERSGFVEACGTQLRAFFVDAGAKRKPVLGLEGLFSFECPIDQMCVDEPRISGGFIDPKVWFDSAKDERAIYQTLMSLPFGNGWRASDGRPVPDLACSPFDVSVDGLSGRAVCFEGADLKGAAVVLVAADGQMGFVLNFCQPGQTSAALREKAIELIARFKIERATGDVALLKWFK